MNIPLAKFIAERRSIAEAATRGPWKLEQGNQGYRLLYSITNAYGKNRSGCDEWQLLHWHDPLNQVEQLQHRDADAIVDQRNCMSILLSALELQANALDYYSGLKQCSHYECCGECGDSHTAEVAKDAVEALLLSTKEQEKP